MPPLPPEGLPLLEPMLPDFEPPLPALPGIEPPDGFELLPPVEPEGIDVLLPVDPGGMDPLLPVEPEGIEPELGIEPEPEGMVPVPEALP
jgi:hypothetical protein